MSVDNNTKFLNSNFDLEDNEGGNEFIDFVEDQDLLASDPVEIIVARVLFALLVSVSLVINLLLVLAVGRRWKPVHLVYMLAASMALSSVTSSKSNLLEDGWTACARPSSHTLWAKACIDSVKVCLVAFPLYITLN